jgi:prophage maintenance system killer protein
MDDYLTSNGWRLTATPQEIDRAFRAVAGRTQTEDYFIAWVCSRTERL